MVIVKFSKDVSDTLAIGCLKRIDFGSSISEIVDNPEYGVRMILKLDISILDAIWVKPI